MPSPLLLAHEDTAQGQLASGISAATLTITLKSGEGAEFPQPYTGTCSSTGSSTTLNDTGDLADVAQYKYVRNVTDGSWAFVLTTGTDSITTTRLQGGTDNTWESGDVWRVDEFLITLTKVDGDGNITQSEKCLVSNRATDTLTVATGGRGYDGSSAQTFDADDYVNLFVASATPEGFRGIAAELARLVNTNVTDIDTAEANIASLQTGAYPYVVATGSSNAFAAATPAFSAYAAGNFVSFKANHTISGSATLNVNSLGAKTIKKDDGATNLASGDIVSGQIVEVRYDGTNFQMLSPLGQASAVSVRSIGAVTAASSNVGSGVSTENEASPTWAGSRDIGSGKLAGAGATAHVRVGFNYRLDTGNTLTIRLKLGSTLIGRVDIAVATNASRSGIIDCFVTARSVGGSGSLVAYGAVSAGTLSSQVTSSFADSSGAAPLGAVTVDTTAAQDVTVTAQFDASDADQFFSVQAGTILIQSAPV